VVAVNSALAAALGAIAFERPRTYWCCRIEKERAANRFRVQSSEFRMVPLMLFFTMAGSKFNGIPAAGEAREHTCAHTLTRRCSTMAHGRKLRVGAVALGRLENARL
jgi:hypothetical protein